MENLKGDLAVTLKNTKKYFLYLCVSKE